MPTECQTHCSTLEVEVQQRQMQHDGENKLEMQYRVNAAIGEIQVLETAIQEKLWWLRKVPEGSDNSFKAQK